MPSCERREGDEDVDAVKHDEHAHRSLRERAQPPAPPAPINNTPFWVTKRSLNEAKCVGIQRSTAMFASTRGPPIKPVCAAMNSNAADEASAAMTKPFPRPGRPRRSHLLRAKRRSMSCPLRRLDLIKQIRHQQTADNECERGTHVESSCVCPSARAVRATMDMLLLTASMPV